MSQSHRWGTVQCWGPSLTPLHATAAAWRWCRFGRAETEAFTPQLSDRGSKEHSAPWLSLAPVFCAHSPFIFRLPKLDSHPLHALTPSSAVPYSIFPAPRNPPSLADLVHPALNLLLRARGDGNACAGQCDKRRSVPRNISLHFSIAEDDIW